MGGNCPLQLHRRIGWILSRGRRHHQQWIAVRDHCPRGEQFWCCISNPTLGAFTAVVNRWHGGLGPSHSFELTRVPRASSAWAGPLSGRVLPYYWKDTCLLSPPRGPLRLDFYSTDLILCIMTGPPASLIFCHVVRENPESAATVESHPCAKGRARMGHPVPS